MISLCLPLRNSAIGQTALCKNGTFSAIDMDRLMRDDPELSRTIAEEVVLQADAPHHHHIIIDV
jgi:hypothetical protein